jgi:hypothetical protein
MLFIFDNETGNYEITLQTTEANPFLNNIRININLLNITLDSTSASAFFTDNAQDFNLASSSYDQKWCL